MFSFRTADRFFVTRHCLLKPKEVTKGVIAKLIWNKTLIVNQATPSVKCLPALLLNTKVQGTHTHTYTHTLSDFFLTIYPPPSVDHSYTFHPPSAGCPSPSRDLKMQPPIASWGQKVSVTGPQCYGHHRQGVRCWSGAGYSHTRLASCRPSGRLANKLELQHT